MSGTQTRGTQHHHAGVKLTGVSGAQAVFRRCCMMVLKLLAAISITSVSSPAYLAQSILSGAWAVSTV